MSSQNQTEIDKAAHYIAAAWLSGMPIPELLQHLLKDFSLVAPVIWIEQFCDGMDKEVLKLNTDHLANQ